jgi:hypothetical protein
MPIAPAATDSLGHLTEESHFSEWVFFDFFFFYMATFLVLMMQNKA